MQPVRPYFPNLDGLRFFAFLLVFISHVTLFIWQGPSYLAQGDLGVSFFFVLSGFLITYLLLFEKEPTDNGIKLANFYARRILRIWPVYFITLCLGVAVASMHFMQVPFSTVFNIASLPWYTGFIANFWLIKHPGTSVILAVLWSISVEEQFYLVWPLMLIVLKKKFIPLFLGLLIVIAIVYRYVYWQDYNAVAYSTISSMSDLAIGALSGYMAFYLPVMKNRFAAFFTKTATGWLYTILIACLCVKMFSYQIISQTFSPLYIALMPVVFGLLFAAIIFEQNYSEHSLFKVGKSKAASYLGTISYGLYAYHMVAITATLYILSILHIPSKLFITLGAFLLTILIAALSFKYIEQKILRFKRYLH